MRLVFARSSLLLEAMAALANHALANKGPRLDGKDSKMDKIPKRVGPSGVEVSAGGREGFRPPQEAFWDRRERFDITLNLSKTTTMIDDV